MVLKGIKDGIKILWILFIIVEETIFIPKHMIDTLIYMYMFLQSIIIKVGGLRKDYLPRTKQFLCCNAGFFPDSTEMINRWGELMSNLSSECDILGVMNFYCEGWIVENLCPNAILMPNGGIASGKYGYTH